MKSIFTLLLTSLLAVSARAADIAGRITVSFTGNRDYNVLIDGRSYYANNSNRIYLNDIRPGRHTIEVYSSRNNNRRANRPVYSSGFTVRPQYDLNIMINRDGSVDFDEVRSRGNNRDWKDRSYDNRDYNDRGYGDRRYEDKRYEDSRYGNGNDGRWDNNYSRALSDYDFNQLVQRIRGQWFGNAKLNTAKDAVGRNYFTTEQIAQLVQLLSSESDRLELAKLAYRSTVDPRNYTRLYSLFSRSAQDELDRYIRDYRY